MKILIYDIEIFPNWFCLCTEDVDTNEKKSFIWCNYLDKSATLQDYFKYEPIEIIDHRQELIEYIEDSLLIGYNNKSFDDLVLFNTLQFNDILKNYEYAQSRINNNNFWDIPKTPFMSIDLMTLVFNQQPKSLKLIGTNLNCPKLQDFPIHYTSIITKDLEQLIIDYCHNDVSVTRQVYDYCKPAIKMRCDIGEKYHNNWYQYVSDADSIMADKLVRYNWIKKGYKVPRKNSIAEFKKVNLKDVISDKIVFKTEYLKSILEEINNTVVDKNSSFKIIVNLAQIDHHLAKGGIHGCPKNIIIEENSDYEIIDMDVGSFYPFLMINLNVFPEHLGEKYLIFFKELVYDRISDKKAGRKLEAGAKKIMINSDYGKKGKEKHWLSSLSGMYKTTLNGQLFLLMLIEELLLNNIWVFYANTDGISVLIHRDKRELLMSIANKWEEYTQLELEYAYYHKCILKDVNNYIIQKTDGSIKAKGGDLNDKNHLSDLKKSLSFPVCATAIKEFFLNNIPVIDTLRKVYYDDEDGIYQFCKATSANSDFKMVYDTVEEEFYIPISEKTGKPLKQRSRIKVIEREDIQKSVRFYIANSGKRLRKIRLVEKGNNKVGALNELCADAETMLFNDFIDLDNRLEPNWEWYEDKCYDIIRKFKKIEL